MKFIADSMLGRLARWLRLLGCDTLYYPQIEDSLLLKIAREENRILLTRDTCLVKVRGLQQFLLLKENDPFKQLGNVINTFKLNLPDKSKGGEDVVFLSRCSVCNASVNNIPKEDAKCFVPEYVYQTSDVFRQCSGCGKFYWRGTHPEKFRKKLSEVMQLI
ncbi:MAG: Mut7-C RNAse domain-containing protein [Thermodesulfovibrionia bacterium]